MIKRVIAFFLLFFGFVAYTHANGTREISGEIEVQEIQIF
jgi:hypothetical protein